MGGSTRSRRAAGDALLVETAERLRRAVRAGDCVAHSAGDEFVVICEQLPAGPEPVVGRIEQLLTAPVHHGGMTIQIGASIRVPMIDGQTAADELLSAPTDSCTTASVEAWSSSITP